MKTRILRGLSIIFWGTIILACQSTQVEQPKDSLTFIDTQKFDSELANSLTNNKNPIDVEFYTPVTPNDIPPRLEKWIAIAESSGGKITVTQPANELAPKDPLLLLSLFTGLWEAAKIVREQYSSYSAEDSVKNRNVNIQLARNSQGALYVQKIIFTPRNLK